MSAPPCVSFRGKKNGRRKADLSPAAAIYAAQAEAVQPPDDRTYSAEVTVFRRNLLHHRSARAECPYTRPIMIPCFPLFVKHFFANFFRFLVLARCSSLPVRTPFPSPGGGSVLACCETRLRAQWAERVPHQNRRTAPPINQCHCEPVRKLAWQSPGTAVRIRPKRALTAK